MTTAMHIVDKKSQRYDRQLRLWGDHGQTALESARVCLINATATGAEILKNIVLPGVGSFTIVDDSKVTGADIGNNFFLDEESLGQSRACRVTELLQELNTDVSGNFVEESLTSLIDNDREFFRTFTIIIATQVPEKTLMRLSEVCWQLNVPLLAVRSYGLFGYLRLQVAEHVIIESHPENTMDDLRLDRPFPELIEYVQGIDFNTTDTYAHSHIPYLAILLHHLTQWKESHDGNCPKTSKEKEEFRNNIQSAVRVNEHGVPIDEENFSEAIQNATKAWQVSRISSDVSALLNDPVIENITTSTSSFWILVKALKEFVLNEGNGLLPLRGSIPDMAADSERYIKLQRVYHDKAKQDLQAITAHVEKILSCTGIPNSHVTEDEIKTFCKNANNLRVVRTRPIFEEYSAPSSSFTETLNFQLEDPDSSLAFYVLLRAADRFFEEHQRFPGEYDDQVEEDVATFKAVAVALLSENGIQSTIKEELIHEVSRFGASELHNIASILGGLASQEVVKIITRQYIPFNNTFIFNGMNATSTTVIL